MARRSPQTYIYLSIVAAIVTMGLKFASFAITRSVGLYSDAAESGVNLIAALFALWALTVAAQPADHDHAFGHSKAEYFSSALEGILILIAAVSIGFAAIGRFFNPQPIHQLELGLGLSLIAAAVNGGVAWVLLGAGRRLRSITLRADAHHLLTDVWTSAGVILGLLLVKVTGWQLLDPIMAVLVAINIAWVAVRLLMETMNGLMDKVLSPPEQALIQDILAQYEQQGIEFHALRTRIAGSRSFVLFHVLVPGRWSVRQGHDLCEEIEKKIMAAIPGAHVMTHLEPVEDPVSWQDEPLDRQA